MTNEDLTRIYGTTRRLPPRSEWADYQTMTRLRREHERAKWAEFDRRQARARDEEMLWPFLWRFVLYVGGTLLAAAIAGYGLAMLEHGGRVHLW